MGRTSTPQYVGLEGLERQNMTKCIGLEALGRKSRTKYVGSGRLRAQMYDILTAWKWLNVRFDCKFTRNFMGFDGFQVIEFAIWLRIYIAFDRSRWLRSDGMCDLGANLRGKLWLLMAWKWLHLRFDGKFTWKFMGFDGFQVIEFAIWQRIYMFFIRFDGFEAIEFAI